MEERGCGGRVESATCTNKFNIVCVQLSHLTETLFIYWLERKGTDRVPGQHTIK